MHNLCGVSVDLRDARANLCCIRSAVLLCLNLKEYTVHLVYVWLVSLVLAESSHLVFGLYYIYKFDVLKIKSEDVYLFLELNSSNSLAGRYTVRVHSGLTDCCTKPHEMNISTLGQSDALHYFQTNCFIH